MKTKNIIIAFLTVAVVTLTILLLREYSENSKDDKYVLCAERLATDDGAYAETYSDARRAIEAYKIKYPKDTIIQAFHFGLDKMDSLVEKAHWYNSQFFVKDHIVGFRFYKAITTRTIISASGEPVELKDTQDLVILPTINNMDLHVSNGDPKLDFPIVWHSRPCPKLCKKKKNETSSK